MVSEDEIRSVRNRWGRRCAFPIFTFRKAPNRVKSAPSCMFGALFTRCPHARKWTKTSVLAPVGVIRGGRNIGLTTYEIGFALDSSLLLVCATRRERLTTTARR